MRKKKQNYPSLLKKTINRKIFLSSILFSILLSMLIVFVFASPSVNKSHFSIADYFETFYSNLVNSLPITQSTTTSTSYPQNVNTQTGISQTQDRFFINAGNAHGWSNANNRDILKPELINGINIITLDISLLGRTANLPIGTIIFLKEPQGMQMVVNSAGKIIVPAKGTYNTPNGVTSILQVVGDGSAEIIVEPILPHSMYVSQNLGLSFYYAPKLGSQAFFVREIGNTIYLYDDMDVNHNRNDSDFLNSIGSHGKTVTVFYKDPQQSLSDAIKQKVFGGNIPSQCYITTNTHYGDPRVDESYERAVIWVYPNHQNLSYQENEKYILGCSTYVSLYGGVSYFMMDPKHPDRFLFIKLGQDNIPSGYKGYVWDATIKVF